MSAMIGLPLMAHAICMSSMAHMVHGIRFVAGISHRSIMPTIVSMMSPILSQRLMALVACGDFVFHGVSIAF